MILIKKERRVWEYIPCLWEEGEWGPQVECSFVGPAQRQIETEAMDPQILVREEYSVLCCVVSAHSFSPHLFLPSYSLSVLSQLTLTSLHSLSSLSLLHYYCL
ncbi:hypothetical protein RJT34_33309 [Clitoria ternatea]|uniref:Uncharacterized protein n=1 Tax=Clitoria ternatea TaxID=43366 RepID=A0AAN9EYJ3_CLITE